MSRPLDEHGAQNPAWPADKHGSGLALSTAPETAGVTMLTARGALTTRTCARLGIAAREQIARVPRLLVVDLAQLTELDEDGVDVLVEIAYEAGEADIGLCLVFDGNRRDLVMGPLEDANVVPLFEIHPTIASALGTLD